MGKELMIQRVRSDVDVLARAGLDVMTFLHEVDTSLRRAVPYAAMCVSLLLELPEEEAMAKTSMVGHVFAPPAGEGVSFLELDPGEYLAVCFIPEGASMEDGPDDEPSGPPHVALGMHTEFTVE